MFGTALVPIMHRALVASLRLGNLPARPHETTEGMEPICEQKQKIKWFESYTANPFNFQWVVIFDYFLLLDLMLCACVLQLGKFHRCVDSYVQDSFMGLLAAVPWEGERGEGLACVKLMSSLNALCVEGQHVQIKIHSRSLIMLLRKDCPPKKGSNLPTNHSVGLTRRAVGFRLCIAVWAFMHPVSADPYGRNPYKKAVDSDTKLITFFRK